MLYVAPLCPAGYLPEGGRLAVIFVAIATLRASMLKRPVISPLAGEMSGRTEGGNVGAIILEA